MDIINPIVIENIGWTIVHSLWQVTLIVSLTALILKGIKESKAALRYNISFAALVFCLIAMASTFIILQGHNQEVSEPFSLMIIPIQEVLSDEKNWSKVIIQTWVNWVAAIWIVGLLVTSLKNVLSLLLVNKLRRKGLQNPSIDWMNKFEDLVIQSKISRKIQFKISQLISSPMTIGTLKPIVLVPVGFFSELSPSEVEAILLHELAHIRRNDYLFNIIQSFISSIMFYHPAIWYLNTQIRTERENACDDFSVKKINHANSLIKALGMLQIKYSKTQNKMAMNLFNNKGSVLDRIKRLSQFEGRSKVNRNGNVWVPMTVLFIGILMASFRYKEQVSDIFLNDKYVSLQDDSAKTSKPNLPPPPPEEEINNVVKQESEIDSQTDQIQKTQQVALTYTIPSDTTKNKDKDKDKDKDKNKDKDKDKDKNKNKSQLEEELEVQRQALLREREQLAMERQKLALQQQQIAEQKQMMELQKQELAELRRVRELERSERKRERASRDARADVRTEARRAALEHEEAMRMIEEKMKAQELELRKQMELAEQSQNQAQAQAEIAKMKAEIAAQHAALAKEQSRLRRIEANEFKKMEEFREKVVGEMIKDNIIKENARKIKIEFPDKGISINGKKINDALLPKYLKLFEEFKMRPDRNRVITIED